MWVYDVKPQKYVSFLDLPPPSMLNRDLTNKFEIVYYFFRNISKDMQNKDSKMIQIGPAAKHLGVSRDTLRRWEKKGKLKAMRSPTNRRYYTKELLDAAMAGKKVEKTKTEVQKEIAKPAGKKGLKIGKTGQLFTFGVISFIFAALIALLIQFFLL